METLLLETGEEGVAVLTINRPDKLNALNNQVLEELDQALDRIASDDKIKGLLITGAGDKAFVAGADISELAGLDMARGKAASRKGQHVFAKIEHFPKPVIAVIQGYALGGGCELALACHIRVAGKKAVFGFPETGLGIIPGYGGTQRLPRLVGKGRAMELILAAGHIGADQAFEYGLINQPASDNAMDTAKEIMMKILIRGPKAIAMAIKAIHKAEGDPEAGFEYEADLFGELCATNDFKEGTKAFLEKRPPKFTGN